MRNLTAIAVILIALAASVFEISVITPKGVDWHKAYYPTARTCLNGQSPYIEGGYFENPIWMCALLAPFGIFPEAAGLALFLVVSIAGYYAVFYSVGVPKKWIPLILLSPQILTGLNMGSIDTLILQRPRCRRWRDFCLRLPFAGGIKDFLSSPAQCFRRMWHLIRERFCTGLPNQNSSSWRFFYPR